MTFRALTNFPDIGVGTHLHIFDSNDLAGHPATPLTQGSLLSIEFVAFNRLKRAQVVKVQGQSIQISVDDGTSWEMTPLIIGQDLPPTVLPGAGTRSSDWVVRREIE